MGAVDTTTEQILILITSIKISKNINGLISFIVAWLNNEIKLIKPLIYLFIDCNTFC
jgi:predicted glycosyltransferase involved in capsule biosynthesis